MFFLKSLYCRVFQAAFRVALPFLPYREPEIINSCSELGKVFRQENSKSILVVTDKGIVNNGLSTPVTDVLTQNNLPYIIYDETLPNPTVINVEDALSLYYKHNCNTIIAIGGGSAMDCAKKFINAIRTLNASMGIPEKLEGIKKEDIYALSRHAEKEANPLYPVPKLMTRKELENFYHKVGM